MNLDAIGIAAKDCDQTITFYNLFGLKFTESGTGHFEASTESGLRVMIDSHELLKSIDPNWTERDSSNITLCFKQTSAELVDELFHKIEELGYKTVKKPWDAFWGQRYASVLDPCGNQIDLFADINT